MRSAHPDIRFFFGQGSPLVDITKYVVADTVSLMPAGVTEELTPYGTTSTVNAPTGLTDQPDLTLDLIFEDEDDGPIDLMGTISDADTPDYTFKEVFTKGSPASYAEWLCAIKSSGPVSKRKGVTRWQVVLTSRGLPTFHRQGA